MHVLCRNAFYMIVQFSVANYTIFRDKVTLSLVASNYDKKTREIDNVILDEHFKLRLLRSAVLFGANASGKTKLFNALGFMKYFTLTSSKDGQKGEPINVVPFRLNVATENKPSEFEILLLENGSLYRYGFTVDSKRVYEEWLYVKRQRKEIEIFSRDENTISIHDDYFARGKKLWKEKMVRENALFLSTAAQFNEDLAIGLLNAFRNLKIISGVHEEGFEGYTLSQLKDLSFRSQVLDFLHAADLDILDLELQPIDQKRIEQLLPKELAPKFSKFLHENPNALLLKDLLAFHKKFDTEGKPLEKLESFSFAADESAGTQQFLALVGPIIDVLTNGFTLCIDELDARLHPRLVIEIVALFNSKHRNPKNAQLIFTSHYTQLLDADLLRRDQVWLVEKNAHAEASLYSLAEFKGIRKNEAFEKNYLLGRYGAVPIIEYFNLKNIEDESEKSREEER